jgi:hypothetical protein
VVHRCLSSIVVVPGRLLSPRSFVVFVVVQPWCTHNPPNEQLLISVGVGALLIVMSLSMSSSFIVVVVHLRCCSSSSLSPVVIVPRCCHPHPGCLLSSSPSSSFVILIPSSSPSLSFVVVVHPRCSSSLFVLVVPVLIIVPPAVHPTSSCS